MQGVKRNEKLQETAMPTHYIQGLHYSGNLDSSQLAGIVSSAEPPSVQYSNGNTENLGKEK